MSAKKIKVITDKKHYEADKVIVTVPLGILKKETIKFHPSLPDHKKQAIDNLGMGVLDKIVLKFPRAFWPQDKRVITYFSENYSGIYWFHNFYAHFSSPILIGFIGGDAARELEKRDNKSILQEVMELLQKLFGHSIPNPLDYFITRWANDPFAYGSYSYIPLGASGRDYDLLAEPIEDKVFFAGEATDKHFFATTHGAYFSGIRAAERIIALK